MALNLEDKKAIVADVNETASNAVSLVVADNHFQEAGPSNHDILRFEVPVANVL